MQYPHLCNKENYKLYGQFTIMQTQEIAEMKQDIKKLQHEIEELKLLFEDALLSKDEIDFVEEGIRNIKKGNTSDFVDIGEI